jgi:SAM-dependent methyltransferase
MDRNKIKGIQNAYDHWSETYDTDQNFTRDLDETVTRMTLDGFRCDTILEIGCGTGKNTNMLAQLAKTVLAIDFSPGMIAKAVVRIQADNVLFTMADITRQWPLADGSIDLVVCNLVLEHIDDLRFIFAETRRILAESGKFYISELHPFRQYQDVKANFIRNGQKIEVQAYVHHISDFLEAADEARLSLLTLKEWWHQHDYKIPPRLVTFLFEKNYP